MFETTKALLESGSVTRMHCSPHHQHYDVAQHSWRMLVLLRELWPDEQPQQEPPIHLIWAVLFHDCAERFIGDMPAPVKWADNKLALELSRVERMVNARMNIQFIFTAKERNWLKGLDLLELLLFCEEELRMGNAHMETMRLVCLRKFEEWGNQVPDPIRGYVESHCTVRTLSEEIFDERSS